jgi:hypothetical protein
MKNGADHLALPAPRTLLMINGQYFSVHCVLLYLFSIADFRF